MKNRTSHKAEILRVYVEQILGVPARGYLEFDKTELLPAGVEFRLEEPGLSTIKYQQLEALARLLRTDDILVDAVVREDGESVSIHIIASDVRSPLFLVVKGKKSLAKGKKNAKRQD